MKQLIKLLSYKYLAIVSTALLIFISGYFFSTSRKSDNQVKLTPTTSTSVPSSSLLSSPPSKDTQTDNANTPTTVSGQAASPATQQTTTSQPASTPIVLPGPIDLTPKCNQSLLASAQNKRDSAIAAENAKHAIFSPTAPPDSSYYGNQMDSENSRHQSVLAQIDYTYQQDLAASHC